MIRMAESVNLGSIIYFIQAKNEDFKRVVEESESKLNNFNQKVQDSSKKFIAWGTGITATSTAVFTAFQLMAKSTAEQAESLEKLSQQTGMSTDSLSKWGYAAKLNKSSLDQLGAGLTFLARNLRNADLESQAAQEAFKELKIKTDDGKGGMRNLGDVLDDIRNRMSKMADGGEKLALVTKLFGKGAADLIPVLSLSNEEFKQLSDEAERLHVVLDEGTVGTLAKYGKSIKSVESELDGIKLQIVVQSLPTMQKLLDMVKSLTDGYNNLPKPIKDGITNLILFTAATGAVIGPILLIIGVWGKLKALIVGNAIVMGIRNITTAIIGMSTGSTAASSAMTFMAASFSSFLVGGTIILGLMAIFKIIGDISERAKLAKVDIAGINDLADAQKVQNYWNGEVLGLKKLYEAHQQAVKDSNLPDLGWTQDQQDRLSNAINERAKANQKVKNLSSPTIPTPSSGGNGNNGTSPNEYDSYDTYQLAQREETYGKAYQEEIDSREKANQEKTKSDQEYYKSQEKSVLMQKDATLKAIEEEKQAKLQADEEMRRSEGNLIADIVLQKTTVEDIWKEMCEEIVRNWILAMMGVKTEAGSTTKTLDGLFGGGNGGSGGSGSGWGDIINAIGSIFGFSGGGLVPAASNGMIVPPSFGTDTVMSALTPKEMVLPVDISEGLQNLIKQGTQPQQVVNNNYNITNHIDTIDQQGVAQFFYKNRDHVVGVVSQNIDQGGILRRK